MALAKYEYEIEEPMSGVTSGWARLFLSVYDQLQALQAQEPGDDRTIPVKFSSEQAARNCYQSLCYRRCPSVLQRSHRPVRLPSALQATQRRDRVFFWLEEPKRCKDGTS